MPKKISNFVVYIGTFCESGCKKVRVGVKSGCKKVQFEQKVGAKRCKVNENTCIFA